MAGWYALNTSEFIDLEVAYATEGPTLPYGVLHHCVIKLSDTEILMTGGLNWETGTGTGKNDILSTTYYHDFTSATWTQGPSLLGLRHGHGCAAFGSGIPIVAGGYKEDLILLDSVELLVDGT